jgi:hypothetical protein
MRFISPQSCRNGLLGMNHPDSSPVHDKPQGE